MESYRELKKRQQDEFDLLPIFFAFSNKQLEEGMQSFSLTMADVDKISSIGSGGYIRKTDSKLINDLMATHDKEFAAAIDADQTGEGFIFNMFDYELSNHEFCITGSTEDTLDAVGLDYSDIEKNPVLKKGLRMAIKEKQSVANY